MSKERHFFPVVSVATVLGISAAAWAGDGVVALQAADSSCADDSGKIYVDCGNGTVTDNRTGLVWLKNASCLGDAVDWFTARDFVAGLADIIDFDCNLEDGSAPGEWRLPSVSEWESMIGDAKTLGCISSQFGGPSITNDAGTGCWQEGPGNSFSGVVSSIYWTSSYADILPAAPWHVNLDTGGNLFSSLVDKSDVLQVWPVRGGQ